LLPVEEQLEIPLLEPENKIIRNLNKNEY